MKNQKLAAIFAALSMTACLSGCDGDSSKAPEIKTIELNHSVTCKFERNANDKGDAKLQIFYEEIVHGYSEIFGLTADSPSSQYDAVENELKDEIKGSLDKETDLSVGDEVTFSWDKDMNLDALQKKYNVVFNYSDMVFKVETID